MHESQISKIQVAVKGFLFHYSSMLPPTKQELEDMRHMIPDEIPESEFEWYVQLPDSSGITLIQLYRQMVLSVFYAENS